MTTHNDKIKLSAIFYFYRCYRHGIADAVVIKNKYSIRATTGDVTPTHGDNVCVLDDARRASTDYGSIGIRDDTTKAARVICAACGLRLGVTP